MKKELPKSQSIGIRENPNGSFRWEVSFLKPTVLPKGYRYNFDWKDRAQAVATAREFVSQCKPAPGPKKVIFVVKAIVNNRKTLQVELATTRKTNKAFGLPVDQLTPAEQLKVNVGSKIIAILDATQSSEDCWVALGISLMPEAEPAKEEESNR